MLPTIYFIIALCYIIVFMGLYFREYALTMLGVLALFSLSVYIYGNGIDTFRNFLTDSFAAVTFGVAAYLGIRGTYEMYSSM